MHLKVLVSLVKKIVKNLINFAEFLLSQHFFDILIFNISRAVAQASINHAIF